MRGRLRPPVVGRLRVGAGERGPDGATRPGVWFETGRRAQVSAPFDGVVVYAGPFQGFETILMINTPDGYTLVLGGLALTYVSEGQSVLAGEPVGVSADRETPPPTVYLGIRRSTDDAENPEEWLRPEFRRGQG
jgi:septal ring factor EnvC (AmiA/AmiB activator)